MKLQVRHLTPEQWTAFADLFGNQGPCSRCWCMYWRIGSAYRKLPAGNNKSAFQQIVQAGPAPGLLAFYEGLAVGWCQLTPRDDLPWLDKEWRLRRVDGVTVWSISCFYIRKGYRNKGVSAALIAAAIKPAKKQGARALKPTRSMPP